MIRTLETFRPETPERSVCQLVEQNLRRSGYVPLQRLVVREFDDGCVRIEGRVRTYYLKQVAQTIALATPGVEQIQNHVEVSGN